MFLSILLNILGIYCLYKQKGGNSKQRMLLANLSFAEIIKMTYNYIPLTTYQYYGTWYILHNTYFDMVDISFMTMIFSAILLISMDRLLCILLHMKYKVYITNRFIKITVMRTWLLGIICGPAMYTFISQNEFTKIYYCMTFDIIVLVVGISTYVTIIKMILERNKQFSQITEYDARKKRLKKMFLIPSMIVASFILFNVIPDLIITYQYSYVLYHVTACLWVLSYIMDPVIYIFANQKSRNIVFILFKEVRERTKTQRMKRFGKASYTTISSSVVISVIEEANKKT